MPEVRAVPEPEVLFAGSFCFAAEKPWDEILHPKPAAMPPPRTALDVAIELPTHRAENAKTSIRWETNLADALMLCELLAKVDPLAQVRLLCESCELPASADYATADLTFSIAPLSAASPPPAASATDCATSTTNSR